MWFAIDVIEHQANTLASDHPTILRNVVVLVPYIIILPTGYSYETFAPKVAMCRRNIPWVETIAAVNVRSAGTAGAGIYPCSHLHFIAYYFVHSVACQLSTKLKANSQQLTARS
jgi:hypothetical protein